MAQLQELEGCSAAGSSDGGLEGGGGICVSDLQRQLRVRAGWERLIGLGWLVRLGGTARAPAMDCMQQTSFNLSSHPPPQQTCNRACVLIPNPCPAFPTQAYAAQEQEASAQLSMLEQQHRSNLGALLAPPLALAPEEASTSGRQRQLVRAVRLSSGVMHQHQEQHLANPIQQQQLLDDPMQQLAGQEGRQQQQQTCDPQQQTGDSQQQQQQQLNQQQREKLHEVLQEEAARVDAEMLRVAVQQQLASSALDRRRPKKARTDSISQVWEWLKGEGPSGGGDAAVPAQLLQQQQQQQARLSQEASVSTG